MENGRSAGRCQSPGAAVAGTIPPASISSFIPWTPCTGVTRDTMDAEFQKKSIFFPLSFAGVLTAEPAGSNKRGLRYKV